MIPWVRERLADGRARWQNRKQRNQFNDTDKIVSADGDLISSQEHEQQLSVESRSGRGSANRRHRPEHIVCQASSSVCSKLDTTNTPNRIPLPINNSKSVRILSQRGAIVVMHGQPTITVRDVKMEAIRKFILANKLPEMFSCDTDDLMEFAKQYKLTHHNGLLIDDRQQVRNVQHFGGDGDEEWLLVQRKSTMSTARMAGADAKTEAGPMQSDIDAATADIMQTTFPTPAVVNIDELVLQSDVQYDIRKILISLANSCAYVIGSGPYASRIVLMLKQRLIRKRRRHTDTVQCFVDMGFSRARAEEALRIKNNAYAAALEWLIEHHSSTETNLLDQSLATMRSTINTDASTIDNIEALLEIIKIHCQRDIPPSPEMVQLIIDMGFDEAMAREALRATKNNQAAACEWLVGNRTKIYMAEQTDGLPADSPILMALLASPHVQLSLSNPKIFLAYLSILEDYSTMSMWLGDADTSGIIGHILRTYHEEKHILAINQFSSLV